MYILHSQHNLHTLAHLFLIFIGIYYSYYIANNTEAQRVLIKVVLPVQISSNGLDKYFISINFLI